MFSNLLPDILNIIFDYAIDGDAHTVQAWKQDLPVLAVCHNWRLLGMSRVYNTVIIESKSVGQPPTEPQRFIDRDPAFGVAASNLDLAASAGALSLLQKLVLCMNYNMGLVHYFDRVQQLLKSHMDRWLNLTSLWVCLKSNPNLAYWSGEITIEEKVNEQTYQLITTLPNIKHITAMTFQDNGMGKHVITKLVDAYAHQLTHIACSYWCNSSAQQFSEKISHINITHPLDNNPLPKVNLDTLKELTLYDFVLECQGGTFCSASNEKAKGFEFKSLKYLNLRNSGESHVPKDSSLYSKLSFPCLSVMHLNMAHKTDRLLTQAHFPEYIDKLVVRSPAHGSITLYRVKFDIDERSQLATYTRNGSDLRFLELTKYLLENHQLYSELHAEFSPHTIFLAKRTYQLDCLQHLVLPTANVFQLLQVAIDISLLKTLTVCKLEMVVRSLDYIDILDDELLPIANSLEHVKIRSIDGNVDQTFSSLFERVLVRTQSLQRLDIPKDVQLSSSLIDQFSLKYPHIQQLHISAKY